MSTADENAPLYKAREPIFPKAAHGFYRRLKWWIMAVTLTIYYVTPWIRWDRGPSMPDQAVLIDLDQRRFFFFWIEIWPHEFYYVAGLLIMAGIGLFLFTSALGRVWCGYTCPQTVWVDLFYAVERLVDGDRNAMIRLHRSKWTSKKVAKRSLKWSIWLGIGLATGGAWVFYFADAPTLWGRVWSGDAETVTYVSIAVLTFTTFTLGGFMREQVCIYMCPWPRIQSAMLDENSLTVTYKDWRGEPRSKHRKTIDESSFGDCIDCKACVAVCPMGIDIRDGQQLECITCALCIDACDEMMDKVGKPRGLIDYVTLKDGVAEAGGAPKRAIWRTVLRPRTILYFCLWMLIGVAMVVMLYLRTPIGLKIEPERNPAYDILSSGAVRNTYRMRILNQNAEPHTFALTVDAPDGLSIEITRYDPNALVVDADETRQIQVFLVAEPGSRISTDEAVTFTLTDAETGVSVSNETTFRAPEGVFSEP